MTACPIHVVHDPRTNVTRCYAPTEVTHLRLTCDPDPDHPDHRWMLDALAACDCYSEPCATYPTHAAAVAGIPDFLADLGDLGVTFTPTTTAQRAPQRAAHRARVEAARARDEAHMASTQAAITWAHTALPATVPA